MLWVACRSIGSTCYFHADVAIRNRPLKPFTPVATGAAYLFSKIGATWDEEAVLAPSDGTAGWSFADRLLGFADGSATIGAIVAEVVDTAGGPAGIYRYNARATVLRTVPTSDDRPPNPLRVSQVLILWVNMLATIRVIPSASHCS